MDITERTNSNIDKGVSRRDFDKGARDTLGVISDMMRHAASSRIAPPSIPDPTAPVEPISAPLNQPTESAPSPMPIASVQPAPAPEPTPQPMVIPKADNYNPRKSKGIAMATFT